MRLDLAVDAGNISVLDLDYILDNGGNLGKQIAIFPKKPGKYIVKIKVINSWLGKIEKEFVIETKGSIVIGDACYSFDNHDNWLKFLDKTSYLQKLDNGLSLNTGGDGYFPVNVIIKRVKE